MEQELKPIRIVRCIRCGHRWATKKDRPMTCANPKCRSPYWDKERIRDENNKQERDMGQ